MQRKISIWLFLLAAPYIYLAYRYLITDSLGVYDASSHLAQVWYLKEYLWPQFSGFNSLNLLGFDQGLLYPSLFHYVSASLGFLLGVEWATKIVTALSLVLLPISVYLFSSTLFQNQKSRTFVSGLLLVVVLAVPGYLGASVKGLAQVGLLPSFVSLPFVFFYLLSVMKPRGSWILSSVLLSIVILTHLVAGIFCLLFFISFVLGKVFARKFELKILKQLILVLGLTAFFIIPFLFNYSLLSQSVHVAAMLLPNVALALLLIPLSYSFARAKKELLYPLSITALILVFIVLVDALAIRSLDSGFLFEKIYNLHLYRYQIYLYLIATVLLAYWPIYFLFEFLRRPKIKPEIIVAAPLVVIFLGSFLRSPFIVNKIETNSSGESSTGRFLETFSREDSYPLIYTAQNKLVTQERKSWAYGLLTDSTPNGPYLGSLIKSFDPTRTAEANERFVERKALDRGKIYDALDLFGIESLLFLDPDKPTDNQTISTRLLKSGVGGSLVEIPKWEIKEVSSNWDKEVENWWLEKGRFTTLLVNSSEQNKANRNSAKIKDLRHNSQWTKFSFRVESSEKVPVLVKFTYLPFWEASVNGQETKIYKASPYLMLVYGSGEVEFEYKRLWYQDLSLVISGFALAVILVAAIRRLFAGHVK